MTMAVHCGGVIQHNHKPELKKYMDFSHLLVEVVQSILAKCSFCCVQEQRRNRMRDLPSAVPRDKVACLNLDLFARSLTHLFSSCASCVCALEANHHVAISLL